MTSPAHPNRRQFLIASTAASAALWLPTGVRAAEAPTADPAAAYELEWTGTLPWETVVDLTKIPGEGKYWDVRLKEAMQLVSGKGGGVVFLPAGTYYFREDIKLLGGVVLRGATPSGRGDARRDDFKLGTRIEFPKYEPTFKGEGTPIETAFKGIHLARPESDSNCGVVHLDINRGHIAFGEAEDHTCGRNRMVVGCILRNAAVADPRVPDPKYAQHKWQRFTQRHHAAIEAKSAENLLVANNRLPKSGDDNFTMRDFLLKPSRGKDRFDVTFDYDNRPGLYISHYCIGGAGGSGDDGTPETHPFGFRKGIVIRDNYVFNTGRMGIGFSGSGTVCSGNVIRFAKDVWRPTNTGTHITSGSSTNDNRAIEMRGWGWVVEDNNYEVHRNWASDRSYYINDGEGLMHEDHCNSDLRESVLRNNRGNSYLSIYKCGTIDGLLVEGNTISTPGKIADIYVVANRNSGPQPCRNVVIRGNVTKSNGIYLAGSFPKGNVIEKNTHEGKGGVITNEANAKVAGNRNYTVK